MKEQNNDSPRSYDLARLILERSFPIDAKPGAQLPTERRLTSELGTTRTAVRNALALLEAEGRISREVGRGTFLTSGSPTGDCAATSPDWLAGNPDDIGPAHVMAVRRLFEPQLLPLVVSWATERDFEEMDRCLAGGDAAVTSDEFEAWDLAFHRAIVAASHNQLVSHMYRVIESARQGRIWGSLKRRNDSAQHRLDRQREHRVLVAALRAREVEVAVDAMEDHLGRVEAIFLGRTGVALLASATTAPVVT